MGLKLHSWYVAAEAISAIGPEEVPESFCDGQFLVFPKAVVCLAAVGDSEQESHVSCPSCFTWVPQRFDYEPTGKWPWLPEKVREVWDRRQKPVRKIREHYIFLRAQFDDRFFYAGQAHLGSYGGSGVGKPVSANFSLKEKLPREIWLRLGGYPGWLVEVNHEMQRVDKGNLQVFERLVRKLEEQEFSHLRMTRYEEDSLTIHTNAHRGWLMYLRYPADNGVYIRDLQYSDDPAAREEFRCVCGIDLDFLASQTAPRELALQAAEEFFSTGQLPQCVHWVLK